MNWNQCHTVSISISNTFWGISSKYPQKNLSVLKTGCRWEVVIMVIDQHTSTLFPVLSFYQLEATACLRLPSCAHWRGNVWEKDVSKCELPRCYVYERNQLWTRSCCAHVGIHLDSYDVWQVFINGARDVKAMKTTINKVSLFWFWWNHMVRVTEYSSYHVCMLCPALEDIFSFWWGPWDLWFTHEQRVFPFCSGVHWS